MQGFRLPFTSGQTLFVTWIVAVVAFISFYLGARFGPGIFWNIDITSPHPQVLLPEEAVEEEVRAMLKNDNEVLKKYLPQWDNPPAKSSTTTSTTLMPAAKPEKIETTQKNEDASLLTRVIEESSNKLQYQLLLGSFSSKKEAEMFKEKFKGQIGKIYVDVVELPQKGTWYRVKSGVFSSREQAEQKKLQVSKRYGILPLVLEKK